MQIQKISTCSFMATRRKPAPDRAATVQDIYEMEDRIKAYNKKLINRQNALIGEALFHTDNLIYRTSASSDIFVEPYFHNATKAAGNLKNVTVN